MSLKPHPPQPLAPEIAAWGACHLSVESPYCPVGDVLFAQFHGDDFTCLYHPEGNPALSPVLLAFVNILQYIE